MKSYWIRQRQIEWSSSAPTVCRQCSLVGPKTRFFKTTLCRMVIFPPRLPLSYRMTTCHPCFLPVTSWRESITDGDGVGLTPTCQQGRRRKVWCTHTVCVFVCYSKENWHVWVCQCWTRLAVADSVFQGKREEEEDMRRRRRRKRAIFFSFCRRKCHHASVCLATGTKSSHTPTRGGKEAAKKGRREVSRKERDGGRRKEEGGGGHLVLGIHTHIHRLEKWENCLRGEL